MNSGTFLAVSASSRLPFLSRAFLYRALLVVAVVILTHEFEWRWLRFLTSEAVLRISPLIGLSSIRMAFDTIFVEQQPHHFATSCTFVDVCMGAIPLIWNLKKSVRLNLLTVIVAVGALFTFNILRLEIGEFLFSRGLPWVVTDEVFGGFAYFAVWLGLVRWFSPNWGSMSGKDIAETT